MTTHVSAEKLTNALDDVLAAPRTDAPIAMVCTRPAKNQRHFPAQLTLSREIPAFRFQSCRCGC